MATIAQADTVARDSRARRLLGPALVAGSVAAASVALHFRDPHAEGSWGICPTAAMGLACPGCGGLRAVNDLTNFQLVDAASSNLLFVASIPLLVYAFYRWTAGRWTGRPWDPSNRILAVLPVALVLLMIVFTVLRNTTAGAWLAP